MQHAVPLKRWRSTTLGVNCGRIPPPRRRIEGKEHDRLISGVLAGLDTPLRSYLVTWPRISPPFFSVWTLKHSFPASSLVALASVSVPIRFLGLATRYACEAQSRKCFPIKIESRPTKIYRPEMPFFAQTN